MGFDRVRAAGAEFGLYSATLPTLSDGDIGPIAMDSSSRILLGDPNTAITVAASALVTPQTINFDYTNYFGRAGILFVDITAVAGTTHTLDVKMQVNDGLSGKFVDIPGVAMAQKNSISTTMIQIVPNIATAANLAISNHLPSVFRIVQVVAGTGTTPSVTYSIGMMILR